MTDTMLAREAAPESTFRVKECPCCAGRLSEPFYEVGPVPVHSCLMLDSAEEALNFPMGNVALSLCQDCGFVTNLHFDPKWSAYAPNYEDQQSFSPTFNSFSGQLATDLVQRYDLSGKSVVEIGCSKGDFLHLLAEAGDMVCTGIDPSALPGRVSQPTRGAMTFIQDYYSDAHLDIPADLIVCRHTLEHIQDVHGTLARMHRHASLNPDCVLMIEVPDATRIWQDCAFEDIYYEHCSYFTAGSLARAVRRAGFAVTDLRREYGDQYLVIEAALDQNNDTTFEIEDTPEETAALVAQFTSEIGATLAYWRRIVAPRPTGGAIGVWGSGSKCVSFVRTLGLVDEIGLIIDINPHRAGKFAPGIPVQISAPEKCTEDRPTAMIVMNPIYESEVQRALSSMQVTSKTIPLEARES